MSPPRPAPPADAAARRELRPGGPWRFEAVEPGAPAMLWQLRPCPRRTCPCRTVDVLVTEVAKPLEAFGEQGGHLRLWFADGSEKKPPSFVGKLGALLTNRPADEAELAAHRATIEFRTAEVTPQSDPFPQALADRIAAELDGTVLDALYDAFRTAQRYDVRTEPAAIADWQPGQLVQWHEAYPDARADWLVTDAGTFTVRDYHCVRPSCTCTKVVLSVFRIEGDARTFVGRVTLRGKKKAPKRFEPRGIPERTLRALVAAYRARHDLPAMLAARTAHLADTLGPTLYATRRSI